jgi:hypothetical protein
MDMINLINCVLTQLDLKLYIQQSLRPLQRIMFHQEFQPLWCSGYHVPFTSGSFEQDMNGNPIG